MDSELNNLQWFMSKQKYKTNQNKTKCLQLTFTRMLLSWTTGKNIFEIDFYHEREVYRINRNCLVCLFRFLYTPQTLSILFQSVTFILIDLGKCFERIKSFNFFLLLLSLKYYAMYFCILLHVF